MNKYIRKKSNIFAIAFIVLVCVLLGFGITSCVNSQTQDEFVVLSTSDMNGKVWEKDIQTGEKVPENLLAACSAIKDSRSLFDDRTITYDCGDLYQNSLIESFNLSKKDKNLPELDPSTICMDEIKYDGYTLGNHEFNYKYSLLQTNYEYIKAKTSLVSANVYDRTTGQRLFDPYITKTFKVDGQFFKVGIIGLENTDCALWDASSHYQNIQFYAPDNPNGDLAYEIQKAQHEMDVADEHCDFVIVSMHNGFFYEDEMKGAAFNRVSQQLIDDRLNEPLVIGDNTEAQAYRTIKNTTGIDMFICGHDQSDSYSNMTFPNADNSKDVLVVNGASKAVTKSIFRAKYNANEHHYDVSLVDSENLNLKNFEPDSVLRSRVAPYVQASINGYAYTPGKIVGDWTINENDLDYLTEQTDYADFINRAQMWAGTKWAYNSHKTVEDVNLKLRNTNGPNTPLQFKGDTILPDMSFTTIPGNNSNKKIKKGEFTYENAKQVYPDDHYVCSIAATGAEIKEMLEYLAEYKYKVEEDNRGNKNLTINGDLRGLPVSYGLNFKIDMNAKVGNRVNIEGFSNGKSYDPNEVYCIMVNSFLLHSSVNYVYEKIAWDRVIIEQDLNHNGTYIRHILDLYATQTTIDFGGIYPTADADKDNEHHSTWRILY